MSTTSHPASAVPNSHTQQIPGSTPSQETQMAFTALTNAFQTVVAQNTINGYDLALLGKENERMKAQLSRRQAEADAFCQVWNRNDSVLVLDNTGRPVELLNRQIDVALRIVPAPPSLQKPFYLISLKGENHPLHLSESDFFRDSVFIQRLQEISGVQVSLRRSMRQTACLLRKAMAVETLPVPFYAGWTQNESRAFDFQLFSNGSTHRSEQYYTLPVSLTTSPFPAEIIQKFTRALSSVIDPNYRQFLCLWFHASALTSLLDGLGFPLPLYLCLSSPDGVAADWAKTFFSWFNDSPILLDAPATELSYLLLCRCDQPLLLLDRHTTQHSRRNSELVEHILITRLVSRSAEPSFPLRALPIVLSSGATALSCSPFSMELDLSAKDFSDYHWEDWQDILPSYLRTFLNYARDNQQRLKKLLDGYMHQAIYNHSDFLREDCARTLGILAALNAFTEEFFACYASKERLSSSEREEFIVWLTAFLDDVSWKGEDGPEIVGRFTAIARTLINNHTLTTAPLNTEQNGQVYYDETSLAFTRDAFRTICARLEQSVPVVLRALDHDGLFCGKPTNSSTVMTRIRVSDNQGGRRSLPAYRMTREAFESFGDPLDLQEVL